VNESVPPIHSIGTNDHHSRGVCSEGASNNPGLSVVREFSEKEMFAIDNTNNLTFFHREQCGNNKSCTSNFGAPQFCKSCAK
jgi:hypothetical protein